MNSAPLWALSTVIKLVDGVVLDTTPKSPKFGGVSASGLLGSWVALQLVGFVVLVCIWQMGRANNVRFSTDEMSCALGRFKIINSNHLTEHLDPMVLNT